MRFLTEIEKTAPTDGKRINKIVDGALNKLLPRVLQPREGVTAIGSSKKDFLPLTAIHRSKKTALDKKVNGVAATSDFFVSPFHYLSGYRFEGIDEMLYSPGMSGSGYAKNFYFFKVNSSSDIDLITNRNSICKFRNGSTLVSENLVFYNVDFRNEEIIILCMFVVEKSYLTDKFFSDYNNTVIDSTKCKLLMDASVKGKSLQSRALQEVAEQMKQMNIDVRIVENLTTEYYDINMFQITRNTLSVLQNIEKQDTIGVINKFMYDHRTDNS